MQRSNRSRYSRASLHVLVPRADREAFARSKNFDLTTRVPDRYGPDGGKGLVLQRRTDHEIGHALGLQHPNCDGNDLYCYGEQYQVVREQFDVTPRSAHWTSMAPQIKPGSHHTSGITGKPKPARQHRHHKR